MSTQWRVAPIATGKSVGFLYLGLDYAGARAGIEAAGITVDADLWAGVRIMEAAARDALNKTG